MSADLTYKKASKQNPSVVYAHCGGPGALKVAEFIADRLNLSPGLRPLVEHLARHARALGFEVLEDDYAPDAQGWRKKYRQYTPDCEACPDAEEAQTIRLDGGRWLGFGYAVAQRPCPATACGPCVPRLNCAFKTHVISWSVFPPKNVTKMYFEWPLGHTSRAAVRCGA